MRGRLTVFIILGVTLIFGLLVARELTTRGRGPHPDYHVHKLSLLTYASFMGAHGPGEDIIKQFEKTCDCRVNVTTLSDSGLLLERLKLAPAGARFDVVFGLDLLTLERARQDFKWKALSPEELDPEVRDLDESWFSVVDWSPLTFIYRADDANIPSLFDDLTNPNFAHQFTIEDPKASAPGLQFHQWIKALGKDRAWLEKFKPNVFQVAPSWSFAYGLFDKKQTRFVYSYLTSLAYHWGGTKDRAFKALSFPEGHPRSAEYVAIPDDCHECDLARTFAHALHQPGAQSLIMHKNFMLPVREGLTQGTLFRELPKLKILKTPSARDFRDWDEVFAH